MARIMQNNNNDSEEDEIIAAAAAVIILAAQVPVRSCWVKEWVGRRETHGAYATIVQELMNEDPQAYKQFVRSTFADLSPIFRIPARSIRDIVLDTSLMTTSRWWCHTTCSQFSCLFDNFHVKFKPQRVLYVLWELFNLLGQHLEEGVIF
ncbi:hypothetical protein BaRGS_00022414 [Batillaria attramentaria]|uniref:Uncharacterized protein n=1 Tax=Batillaria attramentaria TaxID=370345 RepID=A0ABD0KHG5_9CAEN